jgi:hypothetical protein
MLVSIYGRLERVFCLCHCVCYIDLPLGLVRLAYNKQVTRGTIVQMQADQP